MYLVTLHSTIGIVAGILALCANPLYVIDTLKGHTRPSKSTWWVLCCLNILFTLSYYSSGARDTIWIPLAYSISFFIFGLLSLKYGEGDWNTLDGVCILGAVLSALIWWLSGIPQIAVYMIIGIDFFGLLPTLYKSYKHPGSESRSAWLLATFASLLNIFAIENWSLAVSLYPFYVFITNGLILYFILFPILPSVPNVQRI